MEFQEHNQTIFYFLLQYNLNTIICINLATMENSMVVLQTTKNRTTLWSSNSTPGCVCVCVCVCACVYEENENTSLKRYVYPRVHCSIIYNSQDMETT